MKENSIITWNGLMEASMKLPGAKVYRQEYLSSAFAAYGDTSLLSTKRPVDVFSEKVVEKVANDAIARQTAIVTSLSTVAGIPGSYAMIGTIPADLAQYYYHVLVIAQKLCYIYGWPDLLDEQNNLSEGTINVLTLFIGVMLGAQAANKAVGELSKRFAGQLVRRLPQKALTKGFIYPIVKQVAKWIGIKITKDSFAKGVSKAVPIIGAVTSGGLTYFTFKPMARKLQNELNNEMSMQISLKDNIFFDDADNQNLYEQNKSLEFVKILACINMAKIDAKLSDDEKLFLTNIIADADLSEDETEVLQSLLLTKELTDMEFKQYKGNELFATSLIESLVELMYVDGIIRPSERMYLYKIVSDLGYPRDIVEEVFQALKPDIKG